MYPITVVSNRTKFSSKFNSKFISTYDGKKFRTKKIPKNFVPAVDILNYYNSLLVCGLVVPKLVTSARS
eukprot:SAG11_NODE_812_length_7059_cov_5.203017_1_plen_69_part_00